MSKSKSKSTNKRARRGAGKRAPADRIGVGVIGCGGMGGALAGAVAAAPAGRLVAFYDEVAENRKALAEKHVGRDCGSLDELLGLDDVQAVVVAAPQFAHEELGRAAARAGKQVYVEKPMALSVASCDRMIAEARKAGVTLMVGQVLRYYEPFHSIIRWTREGRFGRPVHACIQRLSAGWMRQTWRMRLDLCGGFLFEVSVHELDFMRCILGEPTEVYAVRQKQRASDHEVEDIISVLARFDSGASGHYDAGTAWGKGKYWFNLCFEKASLVSEGAFDPKMLVALTTDAPPQELKLEGFETENAVHRQMRDWLQCLSEGRPVPTPGEEGRETVRLAEAAYRSADTGKIVRLP
jgi:predicted dehydrogenase